MSPVLLPDIQTVADLEEIERAMLQSPQQVEVKVAHHFAEDVYVREAILPKGAIILGHAHRKECLNICLTGALMLRIGNELVKVVAPCIFKSPPGIRKIAYTLEETRWLNVHPTSETDLAKLEESLIDKSPVFLEHQKKELP